MMQSISIYKCDVKTFDNTKIKNKKSIKTKSVNGQNENLVTELFPSLSITSNNNIYQKCNIAMDEIVKLNGRVFNKPFSEFVITNSYDAYINTKTGLLACVANKNSSDRIQEFFSNNFKFEYKKKIFDLQNIMKASNDVKRAQFKKLQIQTLHGSSISGNQVNTTNIYGLMEQAGDLSAVAVSYPFNNKDISFSVSSAGSIVLFSSLDTNELVDFLNMLEFL